MKKTELAELVGIHLGDGYARIDSENRREIDVSGSPEEKGYYTKHVAPLFRKVLGVEVECREFPNRGTYGFRIYGKEPAKLLIEELGMPNRKKKDPGVPEFIRNGSLGVKARFVRGLFDTDGYFGCYRPHEYGKGQAKLHSYPRIIIENTLIRVMKTTESLLSELGIDFYRNKVETRQGWRDKEKLSVVGDSLVREFFREVGSKNPVKRSKFRIYLRHGFCPTCTTLEERREILSGDLNPHSFYD